MNISRRYFISIIGGGTVVAASAGAGFAFTRTPSDALSPWLEAGSYQEPRRFALSHAILAPNPHNLQPWLVDLKEENAVTLYHDPSRRLPETDPFDRQLTIGFGCFLEQMKIAAAHIGYELEITLFPQGDEGASLEGRPVARIEFIRQEGVKDPYFTAIPHRRSSKVPFDMARSVAPSLMAEIAPEIENVRFSGTVEDEKVAELRELIWQAFVVEYKTPAKHMESVNLMRFGKAEINAQPDGISLGGPMLESLMLAGLLTREDIAKPGTMSYQSGIDMYQKTFAATPAFVWLTTPDNSRFSQVNAGRAWLRLNLATTVNSLSLHPVSQALQEYPEMAEHYQKAHEMLAERGETVQMLGRLGYAKPSAQTPRWSLDAKIINT